MNPNQAVSQANTKFQQALEHFQEEIKKIRTGRAHPSMLDGLMVEAYGADVPLIQLGSVSAPEGQLLQITPYDPNNLQPIAAAIRNNQSLGMNPMDDGKVIRVPIPPLNEERRREYVKLLGSKAEECAVSLRNVRRDAIDSINKAKKDKSLGEDDAKRLEDQVTQDMNKVKDQVDAATKAKEAEIMTV